MANDKTKSAKADEIKNDPSVAEEIVQVAKKDWDALVARVTELEHAIASHAEGDVEKFRNWVKKIVSKL